MKRLTNLVKQFLSAAGLKEKDVLLSSNVVNQKEIDFSDVNLYQFAETKNLVSKVATAVEAIKAKGEDFFPELRTASWYKDSNYVFVADLSGVGIVNPPAPEFEGVNALQLKDSWGTQMIKQYLEELTVHNKQSVWVHYFGINPVSGKEEWKSTFVMKAIAASGKGYAVGSGIYNMKMESILVGDDLQKACDLIEKDGLGAVEELKAKDYFKNTFFIFDHITGRVMFTNLAPEPSKEKIAKD